MCDYDQTLPWCCLADAEDNLWTHDRMLWLLEEMLAVKERQDKHLLKNRVVFREIADTFNQEGFMLDWKQVHTTGFSENLLHISLN